MEYEKDKKIAELEQRIIKGIDKNLDPKFYQKYESIAFRLDMELKQDLTLYLNLNKTSFRNFVLELIKDRITQKEYAE